MKRILFLLLLTVSVYGQNPSRFAKIQITGNTTSGTATKVNVQEANGEVNTQSINTAFNKNFGLNTGDVVEADNLLNQYSTVPSNWVAQAYTLGSVVFYAGKQWYANTTTVAGDVPNVSSKWTDITFDALNNNLSGKANLSGGNSFTGNQQITGNISATGLATISGNVVGGGFIKTGAPATNLLVADGSDIPQSTFALASSAHNPVTIGTANGLSLSTQVLSLGLASSGVTGALSGTDWNTFNGKANANGSNATGTWPIAASLSNAVNIFNYTDANQQTGSGFRSFLNTTGSINFPAITGVGFEVKRTVPAASSVGSFQLWSSSNTGSDENLYFRRVNGFTTVETWSSWRKFALLNSADRFLLGTSTDNLTDIAQFNGSAISTAWKVTGGTTAQYQTGTGSLINFDSSVRTTLLTGFTSGSGTVSATDNVLQAIQKLDGNINAKVSNATHTGDATGATVLTLATVNSNVGTFGTSSSIPQFTVNAKGLVTFADNLTISLPQANVVGLTTDLALKAPLASPTFTGSVKVPNATLSTEAVNKGQLDAVARPYKVYTATMGQITSSNPTVIVLENTLSGAITWTRTSTGVYKGTLTGAFTNAKTLCFISYGGNYGSVSVNQALSLCRNNNDNEVLLVQVKNGSVADDFQATLEIRVYN